VTIVIDASVAVKWIVPEAGSDAAAALRDEELVAPVLWLAEAGNALWRMVRNGEFAADEAHARLLGLLNAPVVAAPIEPHIGSALRLATELGHPIYDCLYLAVAVQFDTDVVTADRRFVEAVTRSRYAGRVRLLGTA
jgi:predicted nucleic acid-binding protein